MNEQLNVSKRRELEMTLVFYLHDVTQPVTAVNRVKHGLLVENRLL